MKLRWLIVLAALAFLATLILHAPAAVLYSRIEAQLPAGAVRLHGVQGTLSQGGFSALTVKNRVVLTDARWTLHPGWLALLRLSADLETGGDAVLRASVSRAVFGKLRWSDVDAAASVKALLSAAGYATLPVEGQMRLNLPRVLVDEGVPVHAEGTADIQGLAWTLAREPLLLGDFSAALSTGDKGIVAALSSGSGPLELTGEARLAEDRSYDLHLQLKPRPEASAQLQSLVRSLGQPDVQGWYHIRRQGTL